MIPSRYFFHDGTKYILAGNEGLAMSHFHEVRAHLHQMKRTNVHNLPVLIGAKIFDDGTEASYQLINGIEIVRVTAPIPVVVEEEKEEHFEYPRFVPVIRDVTNQYWAVCLSGTFEPPYLIFSNTFDTTAAEMEDNVEQGLNGRLISVMNDDKLFFVAQDGERDTGSVVEGGSVYDDRRFSVAFDDGYPEGSYSEAYSSYIYNAWPGTPYSCSPNPSANVISMEFTYTEDFNRSIALNEEHMEGAELPYHRHTALTGIAYTYGQGGIRNHIGTRTETYDTLKYVPKGMSFVDISHYAGCFSEVTINDRTFSVNEGDICTDRDFPPAVDVTYSRRYGFTLSGTFHGFYTPPSHQAAAPGYYSVFNDDTGGKDTGNHQEECVVGANMLKYYDNASDAARSTGIMCGRVRTFSFDEEGYEADERTERFIYNYVGPGNQWEITSTEFAPTGPESPEHTIEVNGEAFKDSDGNDLLFAGEIFLARLEQPTQG